MIGAARRRVVAGAVCLALTACGFDGADLGPGTASTSPAAPVVDRAQAIAAAVDIRADGCGPRVGFGTGSMIDDQMVVTAGHVVAGADSIEVIGTDGRRSAGDVVLFDPDLDLAVIRTESPVGSPLPLRTDDAAGGETGIAVLPRLTGEEMAVEVADVSVLRPANIRTTDIYLDEPVDRDGFEIEGSIDPGDSGAMVVLPGGGVGIVWARSNIAERRAWAIDLPATLLAGHAAELSTPVGTGPCIR